MISRTLESDSIESVKALFMLAWLQNIDLGVGPRGHPTARDARRWRMHQSIPEQGKWLKQVITGFFNYHAVPTNWDEVRAVCIKVHVRIRAGGAG